MPSGASLGGPDDGRIDTQFPPRRHPGLARDDVPTGERDLVAAQGAAARIQEAVFSGRWAPGRGTLKHELSPLRRLDKWAHARGYLAQMPEIETPGRRVLGTPVVDARKKISFIFTADEIAAVVARLPAYWNAQRAKVPYPWPQTLGHPLRPIRSRPTRS